jgi:uncharacterized membrane protein YcaP (DUF421 family)
MVCSFEEERLGMQTLKELLGIGLEPKDLSIVQVGIRAVVVFLYCIFLVRISDKRFLSRKSALDAVLGFICASMMARGINGSAPFVPTLAAGLILVMLHRGLAHMGRRWHPFGEMVKGSADLVIQEGGIVSANLTKNNFSEDDMLEDLRLSGVSAPDQVRLAYIERNGKISVVKKSQ